MNPTLGNKEYFPGIGAIPFEGRESDNPLAYKFYDAGQIVRGRTMAEQLRFAVCYWHTFCGTGGDPFGPGTKDFPWNRGTEPIAKAKEKMDARRGRRFKKIKYQEMERKSKEQRGLEASFE